MSGTGIIISAKDFQTWPAPLQKKVLERVFPGANGAPPSSDAQAQPVAGVAAEDEHFAELSPSQARDFLYGCSSKTKAAVAAIASSESPFFQMKDVAEAVGVPPADLTGVWRGLTRRVRTITSDQRAYLIYWQGDGDYDDEGKYVDHKGELTPMTHASLRKAFGIG